MFFTALLLATPDADAGNEASTGNTSSVRSGDVAGMDTAAGVADDGGADEGVVPAVSGESHEHTADQAAAASSVDEAAEPVTPGQAAGALQDNGQQVEAGPSDPQKNISRVHNPENPCDRSLDEYDYETSWYDHTQIYINSAFCEPALWFDNFFATQRVFEEVSAGTYVRWRNEFIHDEEEGFKFDMGLNASVELPYFSHRLRLTFESEDTDTEELRDVTPGASGSDSNGTISLRFDVKENDRSKFSLSVTPSPRIRLRYRYTYPATDTLILRATQEIQRRKQVNSARLQFDLEKLLLQPLLFRSSTETKVSEEYDGVDWLQAFIFYHRLNHKTSMSYEFSANGITEPVSLTTNYRAGIRFRRNFHRPWLFYEFVPEYTWPISLNDNRSEVLVERRSKWLLFFRLEVHFGNAYKRRYMDYH